MSVIHQYTHHKSLSGGRIEQSICGRKRTVVKTATAEPGGIVTCKSCLAKLDARTQEEATQKETTCPQFLSSRTFPLPAASTA